jgi:hypothetical protein
MTKPKPVNPGRAPKVIVDRCMKAVGYVPRGLRLNNPGNLDRGKKEWVGEVRDSLSQLEPRFCTFATPEDGIRAIGVTLMTYYDHRKAADGSKIDTISEIVARWAPPVENDTGAYADHLARIAGIDEHETLDIYDWNTVRSIVLGIITHENGIQPYDADTIDAGLIRAGYKKPAAEVKTAKLKERAAVVVSATVTAGTAIIGVIPDAKNTYDQVTDAAGPLAALAPWLPAAFGVAAFACVLFLAARNLKLGKVLG